MEELTVLREEIDAVDREMVRLFERRMGLALQVAEYKQAKHLPVLDSSREEAVLAAREAMLQDKRWSAEVRTLYQTVMALSRGAQSAWLEEGCGND